MNNFYTIRLQKKIIFFRIFLSMAGLPPSTGFFIKFIVSRILLEYNKRLGMSRLALNLMMLNFIFFLFYNQTLENTGNSDF
jgi:formate hydrogenlyase subunit 3/multisubunit Na+/H+ antiporter MnhD subunit